MKYLSLTIPGTNGTPMQINQGLPSGVPTGGLFNGNEIGGTGFNAIRGFVILLVVCAIFFALWNIIKGGFGITQSLGKKEDLANARNRVLFALWGLIWVFLSFILLALGKAWFGVNLLPFFSLK